MDPEITVSTIVKTHEDTTLVEKAIRTLFPDWDCEISGVEDSFPVTREDIELSGKSQSLSGIIRYCSNNHILDTAFDVHEDVRNGNTERFEKESLWWKYGPAQAINIGDGFQALSRSVLLDIADSFDKVSLSKMTKRTKVICTTVGPYAKYGSLLVESCVSSKTCHLYTSDADDE